MKRAKVLLEVTAGVVPGTPMKEHTKRWAVTSEEWQNAGDKQGELLAERNGQMQGYAAFLMLQPDHLNWVKTEWIWL